MRNLGRAGRTRDANGILLHVFVIGDLHIKYYMNGISFIVVFHVFCHNMFDGDAPCTSTRKDCKADS